MKLRFLKYHFLFLASLWFGCQGEESGNDPLLDAGDQGVVDGDADSDTDADADNDADADADNDSDADADNDADSDADADNDSDTDADADTDNDTDTDADTDSDTDTDADTDADSSLDGYTCQYECMNHCRSLGGTAHSDQTCPEDQQCCEGVETSDSDGTADTDTDTDTDGDTDTDMDTDTDADTDTDTDADADGDTAGNLYNPDFVEFYGEDCDMGEPQTVNTAKLPDLFEFFDGSRMSKKSEWRCRRAELKKAVEKYIHGEKPGKPASVTGSVSARSIEVKVENNGKSTSFSASVSIPSGASGPVPAIIALGMLSLDSSILKEEGVATITYSNNEIASETSRTGKFTDATGSNGASAQVGWAWGVSRIIDVLIDERDAGRNDLIDPTAIGVTGCSRLGKGAFTIGAFDERIALGIPQESGTGGVSAFRVVNTSPMGPNGKPAQSLDSAWSEAQGWFGNTFGNYKNNVNSIPVDTHSLVAMYAPRGLLVLDNSRIGELGSTAQHAASLAGAEVYKALGVEANIAYHGGNASDPHNHCQFYSSQAEPLKRAIRGHLTRTAEPDGRMEPQPVATVSLSEWVDWDTPTLEDDQSF